MILKIELDYLSGPIWKDVFDIDKGEMCTGIDIIDMNEKVKTLNDYIQEMYNSLYEFDSEDKAVVFNTEKAISIKDTLLDEIKKLISLLDEINDGSFEICDNASEEISNW